MKHTFLLKVSVVCTVLACMAFAVVLIPLSLDWREQSRQSAILQIEALVSPLVRIIETHDTEEPLRPEDMPGFSDELSQECRYLYERFRTWGIVGIRIVAPDGRILAHNDLSAAATYVQNRSLLMELGWWEIRTLKTEGSLHILLPIMLTEERNMGTIDVALSASLYSRSIKTSLPKYLGILAGALLLLLAGLIAIMFFWVIKPMTYLVRLGERMSQGSFIETTQFAGRNDLFSRLGEVFVSFSRYLQELSELAQNIARGKLDDQRIEKRSKRDSLGSALADMLDYLRMVAENATKISEGDLRTRIPIRTDMDQFGRALNQMMAYLHRMANMATAISTGDLRERITPRSENDILGNAFFNMTGYLDRLASAATTIATGNLQQDVQPVTENDLLGKAFHKMAVQLRENFEKIQKEVAERTRAQEALQQLNETLEQRVERRTAEVIRQKYILETFMENVPDYIYFKDLDSRFISVNKALAKANGIREPAELVGKSDFDLDPEGVARSKYEQELEIIRSGNALFDVEDFNEKDGRWALSTKMPLRDEHGEIIGTFGISRDITESKLANQQLENAYAEIQTLNERLKDENVRMSAELDVGRRLQTMTLPTPKELQQIEEFDIAGFMQPADEVGGDYYDVLPCREGQFCLGIGDVTGHGLESGVVMLMTQTAIRTLITRGEHEPKAFLTTLNRVLYENIQRMGVDKSLTLSLARYSDGHLTLSGQHEEVLVVRCGGTIERIDTADLGFPIGMVEDIADWVSDVTISLMPGDGVVLYTDGIPEAENSAQELYGVDRLCETLQRNWQASAQEIQHAVIEDVTRFIGQQEIYDDLTLVVLKRR